jgi:hypothetical protein
MANARDLLPEEKVAGSADPITQSELILEESELRAAFPHKDEERTSDEATPPT